MPYISRALQMMLELGRWRIRTSVRRTQALKDDIDGICRHGCDIRNGASLSPR